MRSIVCTGNMVCAIRITIKCSCRGKKRKEEKKKLKDSYLPRRGDGPHNQVICGCYGPDNSPLFRSTTISSKKEFYQSSERHQHHHRRHPVESPIRADLRRIVELEDGTEDVVTVERESGQEKGNVSRGKKRTVQLPPRSLRASTRSRATATISPCNDNDERGWRHRCGKFRFYLLYIILIFMYR
jgi:hypothetical protein